MSGKGAGEGREDSFRMPEHSRARSSGSTDGIEIRVSAVVNPSEVEIRVRDAILGLFPGVVLETRVSGPEGWRQVAGRAPSLERFSEIIAQSRIRDAARAALFRGMARGDETATRFFINKQAALLGKVNLVDEGVLLGPIVVELEGGRLVSKIDELTLHD